MLRTQGRRSRQLITSSSTLASTRYTQMWTRVAFLTVLLFRVRHPTEHDGVIDWTSEHDPICAKSFMAKSSDRITLSLAVASQPCGSERSTTAGTSMA
eukprot:3059321-Pyramimonas_sp.AAC.1